MKEKSSLAGKDPYIGGKYKLSEAISQLKSVLAYLDKYSGLPSPSIKKQDQNAIQKPSDEYEINEEQISGWENLPMLLHYQAILSPYFGDLIKA